MVKGRIMNLKKRIGKRIQELRQGRWLKQSEIAELVGIATKTQSCIETGRNLPKAELLEKYAEKLNVDVSDVLNIEHIKSALDIDKEIYLMLEKANSNEKIIIYKFLKSILN